MRINRRFGVSSSKIIAYQGSPGAHSDMACRRAYPYYNTVACHSFSEAIRMVEQKKADLCMIPIENSKAGRVAEIHNILPETTLSVVSEHFMPIEHQFLGVPGSKISDIKQVYSHPQALMQCRKFIEKLGKNIELIEYSNTANAAKYVSECQDKSKAAIASGLAAELYHLDILKKGVQDANDNTTVFIAMSRQPVDPNPKDGAIITSLFFTARNIPAALYKALGGFATNHVNMIKIESYIPAGESKMAQFFISFEGDPHAKHVQLALEELGFFCKKVKVLGVYLADKARKL